MLLIALLRLGVNLFGLVLFGERQFVALNLEIHDLFALTLGCGLGHGQLAVLLGVGEFIGFGYFRSILLV